MHVFYPVKCFIVVEITIFMVLFIIYRLALLYADFTTLLSLERSFSVGFG